MFEYKVRCRHKLGWKEIKLYADTDIEEFFNRNSIDYVRNIIDTIENKQQKEIERLHSIIKEVREYIEALKIEDYDSNAYFIQDKYDKWLGIEEIPNKFLEILDKEREVN